MNALLVPTENFADLLQVLGNNRRLAIMGYLVENEHSVGQLAERVVIGQSALSQHLAKLKTARLVKTRRDRQTIYYNCASDEVRSLIQDIVKILGRAKAI